MKAYEWIDRLKVSKGLQSDYAAAKSIGITQSAISKYRSRESTLDEETAAKIASMLGVNPAGIILDQAAERTKSPEVRTTLAKVARDLCILCKVATAKLAYKPCGPLGICIAL